ncbi:uncharacterized protein B0I36DRAFT_337692 [Microdochium trichocladiopsis]|uniref:Uncharacterized protein n=1 Tax=Microdochium trichocladiopsis TaxID=1682393 RepID=A0A9P9BGV4_9PEZI|nr:uncharacterized protein B0I36DRAFT_337692 [Microdochium trichocladiopsis]KAH7016447.1 hypothetical protein B0I36DRAFT_337692 [Microdochium trichocladiopsis]
MMTYKAMYKARSGFQNLPRVGSRWNVLFVFVDEEFNSECAYLDTWLRWVCCQIDALKCCRDRITLRKTPASIQTTLNETHARVLE